MYVWFYMHLYDVWILHNMILDFVPSVICSCLIFIFSLYQSVAGHHSTPLFCSLQSFLVFCIFFFCSLLYPAVHYVLVCVCVCVCVLILSVDHQSKYY